MDIKRTELEAALKKCLPGVDTGKMLIEGADTFIFQDNKIFSYNDAISVSTPFPCELTGAVKAQELFKLVTKCKADLKVIEVKSEDESEQSWKIKSGSATAQLTLLESSVISQIKSMKTKDLKWSKIPENFMDGLSLCKIGCNRSSLAGIFVKDNIMVSTDELSINWFTLSDKMDCFWVDDSVIGELVKFTGVKEYSISDAWLHFRTEDKTVFSCKIREQEGYLFPKIKSIIEPLLKTNHVAKQLPSKLLEALDRASALSMSTADSNEAIQLVFKKEQVEVRSKRFTGKYLEKIPWDKPVKEFTDPVSVFVDYAMISRSLKRSLSFYLSDDEDEKSLIFQGEGYIHLLSTFSEDE